MSDSSFQDSVKAAFLECFGMESKAAQLAYLSNLHPRDPQIAEAVGELLNLAGTRIDSILQNSDHSPLGQDSLPASVQPNAAGLPQGPGTRIDRYKILEQIGEGGMGTVFMAQQTSPIKRPVALKIVKPGMDSEQVIARFEAERQALALMEHPNIAKVFDAGTTAQGRPYFVMELVKGVPLTKFCQTKRLSIEERLQLFTELCHGIQHAHQKGIIHRDIKPSNVLVTLHDGKPVVKIIDFGIAKAINQNLTDATLFTSYSQMMGTPLYMSPEQAEISGLDVDTRSDVYSLGVILYELITDTTPFDGDSLRRAGVDEIRRIIRETDPPRPSQRLTTTSGTESTFGKGGERNLRSIHLKLAGELDWIVMKALEKERERRYESPLAFAADINRFLTDQPVQACPPSIGYRFSKAFRKHRLIAISSVWIAATLLIGLFATVVQWRRAELLVVSEREQRRRAEDASAVELKARTLADARLYVNQIRLAHTEWEHGDHVVAKRALETTAVPQRAFEYYLLEQKFSADTVAVGTGHEGAILSLHYNPAGTLIATCGEDQTIRIWDADSATELRVIEGHADVVHEVSFLPDGKTLVSGSSDKSLRLWNVESGKEIRRIDHDDEVTALAVTVDGSLIASGTAGCLIKIWDVESGEAIQEFEPNSGRVITLSFSADGRGLASGTDQNDLDFWQIGESNNWFVNIIDNVVPKLAGWPAHVTQHFEGHTSSVNGVVFSPFEIPDCGPLAISGGDDGMIKGWDWQYGSQVLYYDGHIKPVLDLQPSRDGMRFVSAGVDSTVRVWDVNGAFELFRLRGHSDAVQCAGFNHDGSRVASGGADGKLLIWDTNQATPKRLWSGNIEPELSGKAVFCPSGQRVLTPIESTLAVWDFLTRETLLEIVDVNEQLIASSVWAPEGKRLAILRDSGAIDILDSTNGDLLVKLPGNSTCRCIAFSENGQTLIAGADTLVCWNAQNGQQIAEYDTAGQVNSLAAAGDFCAYATETGKVTVRNVTTGELVEVFASSPGEASWLEFSSDAKHLICVGIDGNVYVWDLEQIALAKQINLSVEDLTAVVTHFASGRIFTGTEDGVLKIWDLESGEFLIEIARTWVPIISLDINADGTKLLSAEEYQGVTTWEVDPKAPPNLNVQR